MVVAPDAVVGVIERAGEIGARVGECEAIACAPMRNRQLEHSHAIHDLGLDRNEVVRVDFARQLEQHAAFVPVLALRRVRCPGGVARGKIERGRMLGLGLHPCVDPLSEAQFSELAVEERLEFRTQRLPIEACGLIRSVFFSGTALHEQPLHRVERRQGVMALAQRLDLTRDAKERGDKIVEFGRKLDDEIGISLGGKLIRRSTPSHQSIVQFRIAPLEDLDKAAVEPRQAVATIEVLKFQTKREGKSFAHL